MVPLTDLTSTTAALPTVRSFDGGPMHDAREMAQKIESVFVAMLMKQMRQSVSEEGLFPGDKSDTFGGMFDMYMGDHIAGQKGIGLSKFFEKLLPVGEAGATVLPNVRAQEAYQNAIRISQ